MSLSREDVLKVSYKAKIKWYRKRFAAISAVSEIPLGETEEDKLLRVVSTPDELVSILDDLGRKASKLDIRIDSVSKGLNIPIDKEKQPDIAKYVIILDEESEGKYISYALYEILLKQRESARGKIEINDLVENMTGDISSDSLVIQDRISEGLAKYATPPSVPGDNTFERYANRYLNNIFSWNEHDYRTRQILNFADNYLGTFPDPAYVPWSLKGDVRQDIGTVKNLSDFWKHFSKKFEGKANKLVGGLKGLTALDPEREEIKTFQALTKRTIGYVNGFLNGIDEIFDMGYTADLICCFVRWSGSLNLKTLKGLRALLQLFQSGFNFEYIDIINSLKDIINNIFRGLLVDQLVALINQIFQRLVDPIKKWINNPDPRWQKVFICTPVDEFINNYIIDAVDYVETLLGKLIINFYKQIELEHTGREIKKDKARRNKRMGEFLRLLDLVILALERSAICGTESSPTGEEIQKLMDAYGVGPGRLYEYPKEDNPNIYNSFIPKSPEEIEEESLGGKFTAKFDTAKITSGVGFKIPKIDECLKKIVPEDVIQLSEWQE